MSAKVTRYDDPLHGQITVIEGKHGAVMTNAKPDTRGRWVKDGNTYRYELTPNRASRRAKR